ncbi:hypothetical protein PHYPSEUDO_006701 [Phytophthora pseudosyringae]|uniref:Uncharacterized protein n=1 Tax=Phytophthora pseudosyringae TaxID=221518 RepID=A0A8T1VIR9_9STRA|nr:hypothetical protein PHYPSEUDO_006701 [Phytophthora pseudosyringae]
MGLLRARRTKLTSAFSAADNEDGSSAQHQAQTRARLENRRRGALYGVSSASGKLLPSVSLQPEDARARRDLLRLIRQQDERVGGETETVYEDEQNDCKHREHLNYRPPLDHIHKLRDLHATVANDCRGGRVKLTAEQRMFAKITQTFGAKECSGGSSDGLKAEWRLGYSNNVDTGSRAGVGGTFEPRDGARERILDSRSAPALLPGSVAVAYPLKSSSIPLDPIWRKREGEEREELPNSTASDTDNQAEKFAVEKKVELTVNSPRRSRVGKKKPWCPASSSKSPNSASSRRRYPEEQRFAPPDCENVPSSPDQEHGGSDSYDHDGLQRFPIRSGELFEPIDKEFVGDARRGRRQQTLLTKVAGTYARVRARMDRLKDPHLRYELPVEDATHQPRAYRLGLDEVPSTTSAKPKKPKFRPKSAGTSLGFQTGCLGPKAGNFLTPELHGGGKVAGARRRPHSASISYFKHATVCCMGPPTLSKSGCVSAATDFRSVVDGECQKRQHERDAILQTLAKRGLLHSIPLAQVFARLRREGLLNISRRLQRSVFERMALDEYMSACGCLSSSTTPPGAAASEGKQQTETPGTSPIKEAKRFCANMNNSEVTGSGPNSSVVASPSLVATRKALVVSRQQFHLALEAFNLSPTDVNLFFSALDLTVSDLVQVWDAMCTVEMLQHEHTAIRRARVQQLQAPPPRDFEFLRRLST